MDNLKSTLSDGITFFAYDIQGIVACLALFTSVFAVWLSVRHQTKTRNMEGAAEALVGFANLEQTIKDSPKALQFYGITEAELKVANISAGELGYFLSNMTTGGIYCRTTDENAVINFFDKEEGYYGHMFKQQASRNAWAICRCCIAPSSYKTRLDTLSYAHGNASKALLNYREKNNLKNFEKPQTIEKLPRRIKQQISRLIAKLTGA